MGSLRLVPGAPCLDYRDPRRRRRRVLLAAATGAGGGAAETATSRSNWVMKILRVGLVWAAEEEKGRGSSGVGEMVRDEEEECKGDMMVGCGCRIGDEEEEGVEFTGESFSRLLSPVSLEEARLFALLSYIGGLAYRIPKIKPEHLLKHHGLRFVTSSLEQKLKYSNGDNEPKPSPDQESQKGTSEVEESVNRRRNRYLMSPSAACHIAAAAASYLLSQTSGILPFRSSKTEMGSDSPETGGNGEGNGEVTRAEEVSFMATTNSVTAVVAGKEEMKQAVIKDLNSSHSTPCEWFVCDDDRLRTRYFVIQGSESLASWQANLLFEPIQFEGMDVLVHRGIYEAAKGIYDQMLPEVRAHLHSHGNSATLRFTGHSLGGSISMLISLMLVIRGEAPSSSLLPVITFGAPFIMCGGDHLLRKLGLPQSHVQAITMHRDVVPRAFSCSYPARAVNILKAINGNFRNHPCLIRQKLLYAPMGKFLILQPDEKYSSRHDLLPPGSGLYVLRHPSPDSDDSVRLLTAARSAFLNSPHPLETLSNRFSYGSLGTVMRNHDVRCYRRSLNAVIKQELSLLEKAKRENRYLVVWSIVAKSINPSISGLFHVGNERLKQLRRLAASQKMHVLVMLLLPAKLFLCWMLFSTVIMFWG